MRFVHLSDLHLGKRLNGFSLLDDQKYILNRILEIIDDRQPDCVLIAGDIYDRSVPPEEAVAMFDDFLTALSDRRLPVFLISGNHDSAGRIAYGGRIMERSGIYLSPAYNGSVKPVTLQDAYGDVCFWLLPFIRRADVRQAFPEQEIVTYTDAVRTAIEEMKIDSTKRNVLLAHQYVAGAQLCESEEIYIGLAENVSAEIFSPFDYTALGHLHIPQNVDHNPRIRYCGTPLKYSFSEIRHKKSVSLVTLREKDSIPETEEIPLIPQRDMQELRGSFTELMKQGSDCYMSLILIDETPVTDAIGKLRTRFPNIMTMRYDNTRSNTEIDRASLTSGEVKTPVELFAEFYQTVNGNAMPEEQRSCIETLIKEIWEGEV